MQCMDGIRLRDGICLKELFMNVCQKLLKVRLVVAMGFFGAPPFQLQIEYECSNGVIHPEKVRIVPSMM